MNFLEIAKYRFLQLATLAQSGATFSSIFKNLAPLLPPDLLLILGLAVVLPAIFLWWLWWHQSEQDPVCLVGLVSALIGISLGLWL